MIPAIGERVMRTEDLTFVMRGPSLDDDRPRDGQAYLTYLRSTVPHARLTNLGVEDARGAPGVIAVVTAADITLSPVPTLVPTGHDHMGCPWLARGVVRYVGEPVAAIISATRAQGVDAAELVVVDYEPLPSVVHPEDAAADEVLLFPDAGTNTCFELDSGEDPDLFAKCDITVSQRLVNQRVNALPMEPRSTTAWWEGTRLNFRTSTQSPHLVRDMLSQNLGLEPDDVRVLLADIGGGFGAKYGTSPEDMLVAWLARKVERPLHWTETRSDSMTVFGHARGQIQRITIGGSSDGRVMAYRLDVLQDAGAYPRVGAGLPFMTMKMTTGPYAIERAHFRSRSVVTNTAPVNPYRGAGKPEATTALERAMDLFAAEISMDPLEVRRRNLLSPEQLPHTTPVGTTYDSGDYPGALARLLERADYAALRAEQARQRQLGGPRQLGIGVATYVQVTSDIPGGEVGSCELISGGRFVLRAGTASSGQGHETAWKQLAAVRLRVELDRIDLIHHDTDEVPHGSGTFASRSLQVAGVALHQAARELVDRARRIAGDLLEADPADILISDTGFHVAGTPAIAARWSDVADRADLEGGLRADVTFDPGPTFPYGAHLALVEVDVETGATQLLRFVAVDDAGPILNPTLFEGQLHGGIAQGVAQALLEEVRYDEDGNAISTNLADYLMISAAELPQFELHPTETPTAANELGFKGIGESGIIASTAAVQSAVVDALAPWGVRHVDLPLSPERIWRALTRAEDSATR